MLNQTCEIDLSALVKLKTLFFAALYLLQPLARTVMSNNEVSLPQLSSYVGKHVTVRMHGNRKVSGELAGFDQFMNLVLKGGAEVLADGSTKPMGDTLLRGQSVVNLELLDA